MTTLEDRLWMLLLEKCKYVNSEQEEITIPNKVADIADMAFEDCPKLSHAYLLPSLRYIGRNVFDRCGALKAIFVERGEKKIRRELSRDMKGKSNGRVNNVNIRK